MRFQSSLHLYTVHIKPHEDGGDDYIYFVPEGFSFWAFIFTGLWAAYHRCWALVGIILGVNATLALAAHFLGMGATGIAIAQFGLQIWIGFQAYDFLRNRLRREGYITSSVVSGESKSRAEQRFFDQHADMISA